MKRLRWHLADWLSKLACKLRGHRWYVGCMGYDIYGNRAADLHDSVWMNVVIIARHPEDAEMLEQINRDLTELGQLAGENWGHGK